MRAALNRRIAWIALCAVFFGALAPSISRVAEALGGSTWVDICTVGGSKRVALDFGSKQRPSSPLAAPHCPFCLLQNHVPTVPSIAVAAPAPVVASLAVGVRTGRVIPDAHLLRRAHQTRAPPTFS